MIIRHPEKVKKPISPIKKKPNWIKSKLTNSEEFFSTKQKGSSAMPHKRNPVLTENLTGIARIIRGNVLPSLENISLWHERDISHSSVERIICPETLILSDFAINRMTDVVKNLVVNKEKMRENLHKTKIPKKGLKKKTLTLKPKLLTPINIESFTT